MGVIRMTKQTLHQMARRLARRWNWRKTGILIVLAVLPLVAATTLAPTALTMHKYVIGGGGGHSEASSFVLDATLGQAIVESGSGGDGQLTLGGGFWSEPLFKIYLPLVLRQS